LPTDISGRFHEPTACATIAGMTNARIMVAIEEVLTATTGAFAFNWQDARDDEGLEITCTPRAPEWVEPADREGWELAHGVDVWVPERDEPVEKLRSAALAMLLCSAIRRAADAPSVRSAELAGMAA
jgi:hypothetical protein